MPYTSRPPGKVERLDGLGTLQDSACAVRQTWRRLEQTSEYDHIKPLGPQQNLIKILQISSRLIAFLVNTYSAKMCLNVVQISIRLMAFCADFYSVKMCLNFDQIRI